MNALLFRLLSVIGRRRAGFSWVIAVLAVLLLVGGVAAGVAGPAAPARADFAASTSPPTFLATVRAGRATVQGVIVAVRPRGFLLVTADRQRVLVRLTDTTTIRRNGTKLAPVDLSTGLRVVVLGRVQANGQMRSSAVSVRGEVKRPATLLTRSAIPLTVQGALALPTS